MEQLPLLLRTLRGDKVERPPVWLMRQAGRYLTEYMELKNLHGFLGLCETPELASEITLQPIRSFDMDAAILFSDILIPTRALGFQVEFKPGPVVLNPIRTASDIATLKLADISSTVGFVGDALKTIKRELAAMFETQGKAKALIGFSGSPWTLACYLTDQGPYKHFQGTLVFAQKHPEQFRVLLDQLSDMIIDYLRLQIESGADVVQLFDTWGGNLSLEDYLSYSLPYLQKIAAAIKPLGRPIITYVGNTFAVLPALKELDVDCISIDWRTDLRTARAILGDDVTIQGNFDPTHLFQPPQLIEFETKQMVSTLPHRYVANLGHGVLPGTPRESVKAFVDTIINSTVPNSK